MSQIRTAQINQADLLAFIQGAGSGAFSGNLSAYIGNSGTFGLYVLYTNQDQSILGTNTFLTPPLVPFSGGTGTALQRGYALQLISGSIIGASGAITSQSVLLVGDALISGYKQFTGALGVGTPVNTGDATNLAYVRAISGVLQSGINNITVANAVLTGTNQTVNGIKTFLQSPQVPPPGGSGDAVSKFYVDNVVPGFLNVVQLTGDQTVSGVKTFLQSPIVPIATLPNQAVTKSQLDSIGNVMAPITGFAGVISINGISGASGYIFLQGAGTVAVTQCANIFYISGVGSTLSQLYNAFIPIPSGATGLSFVYTTPLSQKPVITNAIETTGSNVISIAPTIYGSTISGFNVKLSTGTPDGTYLYDFTSFPITGSGFSVGQGQQGNTGPSINVRGFFQIGQTYAPLDVVYAPTYNASYISNNTAVSTSLNAPGGTGNGQWIIFSTGVQGATGYWQWKGNYNAGAVYSNAQSTFSNGSSYGFTGAGQISGVTPDSQTGGWALIASKGDLGYYIHSGTLTGSFLNASLYLSPVNTGLDLIDAQIGFTSIVTGFQLRCRVSGAGPTSGGALLSGSLYVVGSTNNKTTFQSFTFNSGLYSYYSGGLSYNVTGGYSIGVDITSTLSGIDKFSIGIFGFTSG